MEIKHLSVCTAACDVSYLMLFQRFLKPLCNNEMRQLMSLYFHSGNVMFPLQAHPLHTLLCNPFGSNGNVPVRMRWKKKMAHYFCSWLFITDKPSHGTFCSFFCLAASIRFVTTFLKIPPTVNFAVCLISFRFLLTVLFYSVSWVIYYSLFCSSSVIIHAYFF